MILVECDPDEALVMCLGVSRKHFRHTRGKFKICNDLSANLRNSAGLIEEDDPMHQPLYLKSLKLQESKLDISIYADTARNNKVILISPTLEAWVIRIVVSQELKLSSYGLPDKFKELHEVINNRIPQFKKLVNDLVESKEPSILFLQSELNRFK